ncbi:MAG: tetratricopeptide repeat protein [Anaerolineae bacterium]|nr:tetratricopeptide repeat protein [Anaerolineae bacterium]
MKYNRQSLERRAAEYYASISPPKEKWVNYRALEPKINEFEHLLNAGNYDDAARLMNEIDFDYLLRWGNTGRILMMRQPLVTKIKDRRLAAQNMVGIGLAFFHRGDHQSASSHFEQALGLAREINDRETECRSLSGLGNANRLGGKIDQAIERYQQALIIAVELKDKRLEANNLAEAGTAYSMKGQSKLALENYQQALVFFREIKDRRGEGMCLIHMGIDHQELGDEKQAIQHYEQGLKIAEETNNLYIEQVGLMGLGDLYRERGNYDQALETFKRAWSVSKRIVDTYGEGYSIYSIGRTHLNRGETTMAQHNLEDAVKVGVTKPNAVLLNPLYTTLAQTHLVEKRLSEGLAEIEKALPFAPQDEEGHRTYLIQGIILARMERYAEAQAAFEKTISAAGEQLGETEDLFAPKYSRGLALTGLGLIAEQTKTEKKADEYLREAVEAMKAARENRDAPGVLADARQVLDTLRPLDTIDRLSVVRKVLDSG